MTWIVHGALTDAASNVLSLIGFPLLPLGGITNMRNEIPKLGSNLKGLGDIGSSTKMLGTLDFYFYFGTMEHLVILNNVFGSTPLSISSRDFDE